MEPSAMINPPLSPVLIVEGLSTLLTLNRERMTVPLVEHFDLRVYAGERWAIVGESGSGKSIAARSIMSLVDPPLIGKADRIEIAGLDLSRASRAAWRNVRGERIAMILQDPLTALSPVFTIGNQLIETIRRRPVSVAAARDRSLELLRQVGIPDPALRMNAYPHELSGGMRQRIAIALALACEPRVLIADEPTTALDVTVQAQILNLLVTLSERSGTAVVMITHDIGILPEFAHNVAVMYGGRLMETGSVNKVLNAPLHPYTQALLRARPGRSSSEGRRRLPIIDGAPPDLFRTQRGCPFAPRCDVALSHCGQIRPETTVIEGRRVACHLVTMAKETSI
jgi:oligopeptide/dipeptide ABC transporter ATP-binding protein